MDDAIVPWFVAPKVWSWEAKQVDKRQMQTVMMTFESEYCSLISEHLGRQTDIQLFFQKKNNNN